MLKYEMSQEYGEKSKRIKLGSCTIRKGLQVITMTRIESGYSTCRNNILISLSIMLVAPQTV